jgi:drug/metabolite transporter (DMT)-like permease
MVKISWSPVGIALLSATLFGISTPLSKILVGDISPVFLVSFLYFGTALGMFVLGRIQKFRQRPLSGEAGVRIRDAPWLLVAILAGGVIAPILLMSSLEITPAATASLLLNFEAVATVIIAFIFFRESVGVRIWIALGIITFASILLAWNPNAALGLSIGAIGILFACFFWGVDNNATRNISGKDPITIVAFKGFFAGCVALVLAVVGHNAIPGITVILAAMVLGFLCYGVSMILFIRALRDLGAARTGAYYSIAPFIGASFSFLIFGVSPDLQLGISFGLMALGALVLTTERHAHLHHHVPFEHEHLHHHPEEHHQHIHEGETRVADEHSHPHVHESLDHDHPHSPDIHHRHEK